VQEVTEFGIFVDVGADRDGYLSARELAATQRGGGGGRGAARGGGGSGGGERKLRPGERIEDLVVGFVDVPKHRITLHFARDSGSQPVRAATGARDDFAFSWRHGAWENLGSWWRTGNGASGWWGKNSASGHWDDRAWGWCFDGDGAHGRHCLGEQLPISAQQNDRAVSPLPYERWRGCGGIVAGWSEGRLRSATPEARRPDRNDWGGPLPLRSATPEPRRPGREAWATRRDWGGPTAPEATMSELRNWWASCGGKWSSRRSFGQDGGTPYSMTTSDVPRGCSEPQSDAHYETKEISSSVRSYTPERCRPSSGASRYDRPTLDRGLVSGSGDSWEAYPQKSVEELLKSSKGVEGADTEQHEFRPRTPEPRYQSRDESHHDWAKAGNSWADRGPDVSYSRMGGTERQPLRTHKELMEPSSLLRSTPEKHSLRRENASQRETLLAGDGSRWDNEVAALKARVESRRGTDRPITPEPRRPASREGTTPIRQRLVSSTGRSSWGSGDSWMSSEDGCCASKGDTSSTACTQQRDASGTVTAAPPPWAARPGLSASKGEQEPRGVEVGRGFAIPLAAAGTAGSSARGGRGRGRCISEHDGEDVAAPSAPPPPTDESDSAAAGEEEEAGGGAVGGGGATGASRPPPPSSLCWPGDAPCGDWACGDDLDLLTAPGGGMDEQAWAWADDG